MRRVADHWWLVGAMLLIGVLAVSGVLRASQLNQQRVQQRAAEHQTVLLLRQSVGDVLARELALARVIRTLHGDVAARWPALASIVTSQPVANSSGFIEPVAQRDAARFTRKTGLRLVASPAPGVVIPAGRRAVHLVVTQLVQKGVRTPRLGLDLAANPLRRALLLQAARSGGLVASPPVEFLSGPIHQHGVIVYKAVRDGHGILLGWVVATYEARRLADLVTTHAPGTVLTIRDGSTVLVSSGKPFAGQPATVTVAGRRWTVWATVSSAAVSGMAWLVLGFGLCLVGAVCLILRQSSSRARSATMTLAQRDHDEAALSEIATLVAENATPAAVFALVAKQIGVLFDSRTAAVSRFDAVRRRGIVVGGWTREGQDLAGAEYALDGVTASAEVFRTHGSVARTERAYRSASDPIASMMSTLDATGGIAAPIFVAGKLWGALGAAYSDRSIPADAENRLERFARLVGLTISNTEAWDRLDRLASTDAMTGLANRRVFHERLNAELARASRHQRSLSIALFDLDHFKRINDQHGHQAGDHALIRFAALLQGNAREGELCARIGGEEFAWIMPETDQAGAFLAAERIREALVAEPFPGIGTITMSAGVREANPGDDADALIRDGDRALYWAKGGGRNMTCVYRGEAGKGLPSSSQAETPAR